MSRVKSHKNSALESIRDFPGALWRDVAEPFGKLSDHGKAEDRQAGPQPRAKWESRAGRRCVAPAKMSGARQGGWGVGGWGHH